MGYNNFEELPIWIEAREIVNDVYDLIRNNQFLKKDKNLSDQLTRASLSIMNNIAEGFDSGGDNEFVRFLKYSQRSCSEVMSLSYVLNDVYGLKTESEIIYVKAEQIRKQIKGFVKYLVR